jgi:hypothetical protein
MSILWPIPLALGRGAWQHCPCSQGGAKFPTGGMQAQSKGDLPARERPTPTSVGVQQIR